MSQIVTVLGGTGTSGSAVAEALVRSGARTRVVTRSPESAGARRLAALGCEPLKADLFDQASVEAALRGSDAVYLAGASKADRWNRGEATQGMIAIDAALAAGVGHFIYQSALVADARGVLGNGSKRAIEERLAELDFPATILRPAIFMENLLTHSLPRRNEAGQLVVAMALPVDLRRGYISVRDIGRAAVRVAKDGPGFSGTIHEIVGDDVSLADIARIVGELIGEAVVAESVPLEKLEAISPPVAAVYRWLTQRTGGESHAPLQALVGPPIGFRAWAADYLVPALNC